MHEEDPNLGQKPGRQWNTHARQWSNVGSPLRPCAEDSRIALATVDAWAREHDAAALDLVVLGVTPEMCTLPVAAARRAVAVDNSQAMIGRIWPGRVRDADAVVCADWRAFPFAPRTFDVALGDGTLSNLVYPGEYLTTLTGLAAVLKRPSIAVIRCFVSPDGRESVDEVFAAVAARGIGSFHALKWRLAMAVQAETETGVAVGDVWTALDAEWPDRERLAAHTGWPLDEVRTIEAYRGVATRYTFPTHAEYVRVFEESGFTLAAVARPTYELGDRCLTYAVAPAEPYDR